MRDEDECTCETDDGEEHTCPYKIDVGDGDEAKCTCCDYCTGECAADI